MVVVVQSGLGQRSGLLLRQLAQGHAGFETQFTHTAHHLQHIGHILLGRMLPRRAHAETGRADGLGGGRFVQHLLHLKQLLLVQAGVVVAGLGAVLAILGAGAGLDRQQGGYLHAVGVEVLAVHCLRLEQQVIEGLAQQGQDFCLGPVVAGNRRGHREIILGICRGDARHDNPDRETVNQ